MYYPQQSPVYHVQGKSVKSDLKNHHPQQQHSAFHSIHMNQMTSTYPKKTFPQRHQASPGNHNQAEKIDRRRGMYLKDPNIPVPIPDFQDKNIDLLNPAGPFLRPDFKPEIYGANFVHYLRHKTQDDASKLPRQQQEAQPVIPINGEEENQNFILDTLKNVNRMLTRNFHDYLKGSNKGNLKDCASEELLMDNLKMSASGVLKELKGDCVRYLKMNPHLLVCDAEIDMELSDDIFNSDFFL